MTRRPDRRPVTASTVRLRLTLWNVFVLGMALLVSGMLLLRGTKDSLQQGVDDDLLGRSHYFTDNWPMDSDRIHRYLTRPPELNKHELLTRPHVVDPQGRDYFRHLPVDLQDYQGVLDCFRTGHVMFSTIAVTDPVMGVERFRVMSVPLSPKGGRMQAVMQSASSLLGAENEIHRLTQQLLELIPLALLISGLGAAFLTDRAMRPVRAVTRAAAGIGDADDLSARLTVVGNDEFSHLAETFNGMIARLETTFRDLDAAYQQQRQFVADASHELRTPLTIIKANTSLALSDPDLDADMRETLTEIDRGVDRTTRIVQDLFLLARSDAGRLPLSLAPVNMGVLLSEVADQGRFLARQQGGPEINVSLPNGEVAEDGLFVRADATSLERLFGNLIENAIRHTSATGTITITAGLSAAGSVEVTVKDTGEGIPPEHLPHVLERFYRVDSARARTDGGTGLGLAICNAIAYAHGGNLKIASKVGEGTTVTLTLPRAPDTARSSSSSDISSEFHLEVAR